MEVKKGVDKTKKAESIINKSQIENNLSADAKVIKQVLPTKYQLSVKGDRK